MNRFKNIDLRFKILTLLSVFLFLNLNSYLLNPVYADEVSDKGINFLKSKQEASGKITGGFSAPSQWSAIAFAANGVDLGILKNFLLTDIPTNNSATEWENRILAIVATNNDPTNFGGTNYLQKLESFASSSQIGDVCSLNDDIFGLLALIASGNAANSQIKQDTLNFIISKQDPNDGGFGFSAPGCAWYSTSADMTGAGLQALQAAKDNGLTHADLDNALTKAKNYLLTNQYSDGGFGYYGSSDADTTGWVLMAFNVMGMKDSEQAQKAKNYLLGKQSTTDGGFLSLDYSSYSFVSNSTTTAQALIALAGKGWILRISTLPIASSSPTPAPSSAPSSITSANLSSLFDNGVFTLPEGKSKSATPRLTLSSQTKITLATDSQTSVTLPQGTIITRSDGQDLDAGALQATTVATSNVSGLSSNLKAIGALQWGLPNISLSFSEPITLSMFLGTLYNGSTFTIARSTTGTDNWTTDGLTSSTCIISSGLCSFQATKASVYVATQTTTTTTTTTTSSTPSPTPASQTCSEQKPGSAPTLLSAEAISDNQVKLTWSKASDPVSYYLVAYGRTQEKLEYGAPNVGGKDTTSYLVSGLSGGTTYYFKVRAGNGCTPGDYSSAIAVTAGGQVKETPPEGFLEGVLGAKIATPSAIKAEIAESPVSDNTEVKSFKSNRILFIILSAVSFILAFIIWRTKLTNKI